MIRPVYVIGPLDPEAALTLSVKIDFGAVTAVTVHRS
jgi:hypothetical protein